MAFRDSVPPRLRHLSSRFHWTTWLMLALGIWALPRLLPHVGALVNVTARDRSTPTFAVHSLADSTITSQSLRGRVVLVNVWATWCRRPRRSAIRARFHHGARHQLSHRDRRARRDRRTGWCARLPHVDPHRTRRSRAPSCDGPDRSVVTGAGDPKSASAAMTAPYRYPCACNSNSSAYRPFRASSSSCVPIESTVPSFSTRMRSAMRTLEKRCEISMLVRPALNALKR